MIRIRGIMWITLLVSAPLFSDEVTSFAYRDDLDPSLVRSGYEWLTKESKALQDDEFENPGWLWVEHGRQLFVSDSGESSCASCHQTSDSMFSSSATRFPRWSDSQQTLINLEGQINQCRELRMARGSLALESPEMLSLTAFISQLARGQPVNVPLTEEVKPFWQAGRDYFFRRKGQMNLACSQCHDERAGQRLRGDLISQGHPNGFPLYRYEWQSLGSLHRRLQDCDAGIRAEPQALGSEIYLSVELYLAWRARGLILESPAIRR